MVFYIFSNVLITFIYLNTLHSSCTSLGPQVSILMTQVANALALWIKAFAKGLNPSIHPSIFFRFFGVGSWGQQPKGGNPQHHFPSLQSTWDVDTTRLSIRDVPIAGA